MNTPRHTLYLLRLVVALLFVSAFLSRCASMMTPTGGPRDSLPPVIVNMTPDNNSTNRPLVGHEKIYIEFDEFVQLKDQQKEFFTSPAMKKKPTVSLRGRGVVIQLRDTLAPNTTYSLNFGSAIRDNNEGNPLYSMRYVFSTGPEIDSMLLTGYTADSYKADSVSKTFIWFFPADSVENVAGYDSTIFKYKPAAIARAEEEIREFVKKTDIPFQPMSMAKGVVPDTDPHSTASCRSTALRNADVVLLVGARLNWMLSFGQGKTWNEHVKFIQIDINPEEIENTRSIDVPIVGDIRSAMTLLNGSLEEYPFKADETWLNMLKEASAKNVAKFETREQSDQLPMSHFNALGAIKKVYSKHHEDLILTNEGANSLDDCRNIIDMLEPRHRLDCGTWGVMGCGTGYAIGAALSTGKKVLYIGGDSAFGFDGMEVEVACRYQLPITFVVLNNGGIYRGDFENLGADGDPSPLTLTYNAHYEKVLEAFGGKGYYATTPEEVERMVGEAVESGKPSFVHVQIAQYAGKESGNIGALNPKPVVGALVDSEVTMYDYATGARM